MTSVVAEGLAVRRVVPELLDGLNESDPRAVASRRDLARINGLMWQAAIMARLLRRHAAAPPRRILEIGGGDGAFMLSVARHLAPRWREVELVLLDREELVTGTRRRAFARLGWRIETVGQDVFAWLGEAGAAQFDLVTANLFLHHFNDADLPRLLVAVARITPAFVATEPRRGTVALAASHMLWAIGANDVTRHDAPESVRAGFAGNELSRLWPQACRARIEERRAGLFTHVFAVSPVREGVADDL